MKKSIKKIGGTTLKADFYHAFMDLGSTLVAIIGIILVSYGFFNGDFIAALVLGGLLAFLSLKLIYKTAQELTDIISPELVKDRKTREPLTPWNSSSAEMAALRRNCLKNGLFLYTHWHTSYNFV